MTSTLDLYEKNGNPLTSGSVTLTRVGATPTTNVIAAVAGKRIVPVWAVYSCEDNGGAGDYQFGIRSSAAVDADRSQFIVDHMTANPDYAHAYFLNFGGREISTCGIGDGLQFWFYEDVSAEIKNARLSVGYYLLDN